MNKRKETERQCMYIIKNKYKSVLKYSDIEHKTHRQCKHKATTNSFYCTIHKQKENGSK